MWQTCKKIKNQEGGPTLFHTTVYIYIYLVNVNNPVLDQISKGLLFFKAERICVFMISFGFEKHYTVINKNSVEIQ